MSQKSSHEEKSVRPPARPRRTHSTIIPSPHTPSTPFMFTLSEVPKLYPHLPPSFPLSPASPASRPLCAHPRLSERAAHPSKSLNHHNTTRLLQTRLTNGARYAHPRHACEPGVSTRTQSYQYVPAVPLFALPLKFLNWF